MSEYDGFNAVSASGFKVAKLGQSFFDQLVVYNMMYIVRYIDEPSSVSVPSVMMTLYCRVYSLFPVLVGRFRSREVHLE